MSGRPERGGPTWWATLTDEAARDEIEANRRAERHVAFAGVAGLVVTVLVILVVLAGR